MYPNKNKKDPSGVVYVDLINTKFKDYHKEYRHPDLVRDIPYNYLMRMWRELDYDCDFWVFLLEHYRYHIHGHKKSLILINSLKQWKQHINKKDMMNFIEGNKYFAGDNIITCVRRTPCYVTLYSKIDCRQKKFYIKNELPYDVFYYPTYNLIEDLNNLD